MRDPSIHIRQSDLVVVLGRINLGDFIGEKDGLNKLAAEIVAQSKRKSIPTRSVHISNDKLHKKVEKVIKTGISEAELFSQLITLERKRRKHRGIMVSKIGDRDWLQIKEVASMAVDFCNEFGLEVKQGFTQYIRLGMDMMKNYSLNKFRNVHAAICKRYESIEELQTDTDREATEELYNLYTLQVANRVGFSNDYRDQPDKYVGFKRAKDQAKEMKVSLSVFVKAQFYALEWAGGIPDPLQLYGPRAQEAVIKYCYENNIRLKQQPKVDLSKLRRRQYDDN